MSWITKLFKSFGGRGSDAAAKTKSSKATDFKPPPKDTSKATDAKYDKVPPQAAPHAKESDPTVSATEPPPEPEDPQVVKAREERKEIATAERKRRIYAKRLEMFVLDDLDSKDRSMIAQWAKTVMRLDEAEKVIDVDRKTISLEDLEERLITLLTINDIKKGGSTFVQEKIRFAHAMLEEYIEGGRIDPPYMAQVVAPPPPKKEEGAEEAQKTEEQKKAEEGQKTEEQKKAEEGQKTEEQKKTEEGQKAEDQKKVEEQKKAEGQSEQQKKTEEAQKSSTQKTTEEAPKSDTQQKEAEKPT